MPEARFPRTENTGSPVSEKNSSRKLGELEAAHSPTGSTPLLQQCLKNLSFWYTFLSSLKGGVYGISYCSKTRLRIIVSLFVSIFEF
jgi:hypothetical protein